MAILGFQAGKQRLCRKAMQPQSSRRSVARQSAAEIWQARADGYPAALFPAHHRDRRQDSQWSDRQGVLRKSLVQQHSKVDRRGQGSARACTTRLGIYGRVPLRASPIKTTSSRTTGTGSRPGALAKLLTMARMRLTSADGLWTLTILAPFHHRAADTTTRMIGSSTTPWLQISTMPTR